MVVKFELELLVVVLTAVAGVVVFVVQLAAVDAVAAVVVCIGV